MRPSTSRPGKVLTKRASFGKGGGAAAAPAPAPGATPYPPAVGKTENGGKGGFSITFVHLGRKYYQITLWASTHVSQRKWVENIARQQERMRERSTFFETEALSEGFFVGLNRANCAAPFGASPSLVFSFFFPLFFFFCGYRC